MKLIYLLFIFIFFAQADEIQRIESIVKDIEKLRVQYEECQKKSQILKVQNEDFDKKINSLKNKIKYQEKQLKSKGNELKKLKKIQIKEVKTKEKPMEKLVFQKCEEANPFPKLRMKKGFNPPKKLEKVEEVKPQMKSEPEKIEFMQAKAFRLNKEANIYDAIDGKILEQWEEKTSFTSNQRTQNWIKITGYFTNKIWHKSKRELWIRADDATQR
jgi:septal ring factor EnvC (AmiA/AmiB activator)